MQHAATHAPQECSTVSAVLLEALLQLKTYVERNNFDGYDPYDALNGWFPFFLGGKWGQAIATQCHKRNPINLRMPMGICKGRNPKAIGLFLAAYCKLARDGDIEAEGTAEELFQWLIRNRSENYGGSCWGYNFDWVNPVKTVKAGVPSVVVTAFVAKGLFEYFELTGDELANQMLESCCAYITDTLPRTNTREGVCFSYTHLKRDCVFNANMLAAEVLAMGFYAGGSGKLANLAKQATDFTIAFQKEDGRWNYSRDLDSGGERPQVDFHQGFVLDSMESVVRLLRLKDSRYENALQKGARFYRDAQFRAEGRSLWRLPREWPVDIHNQAQGILTLTRLAGLDSEYRSFAERIAWWTVRNMQDRQGYFYYQKFPSYTNKISYMRWAQAWMFLALVELKQTSEVEGKR